MSDRTLVLLKPDAVERKLVGSILDRFESKNLDIVAMELRQLDAATLERHYEEHVGKPFYADLVVFMSRGPVVAMVVEGPEDTWEVVRTMMGATNPALRHPGQSVVIWHSVHRKSCSRQRFARKRPARNRHFLPESVTFRPQAHIVCGGLYDYLSAGRRKLCEVTHSV